MIDTNQKIKFTDVQIEGLKRSILHKQITDKEIAVTAEQTDNKNRVEGIRVWCFNAFKSFIVLLQKLPEDTKVYEGVGRCFFVSSVPEIRTNLTKQLTEFNEKIKTFEVMEKNCTNVVF